MEVLLINNDDILKKRRELINVVKRKRRIKNYSQKEIAMILNTSQQSISLIEKIERCPSIDTFIKYAGVMGLEIILVDKENIEI